MTEMPTPTLTEMDREAERQLARMVAVLTKREVTTDIPEAGFVRVTVSVPVNGEKMRYSLVAAVEDVRAMSDVELQAHLLTSIERVSHHAPR
jgi:hypothetical protein